MTKDMKKKIIILIAGIILAVAIGGSLIWILTKQDTGKTNTSQTNEIQKESEDSGKAEDKEASSEQKDESTGYISDCDSFDNLEEYRSVMLVTGEGQYVQGTGAFCNAETSNIFANFALKESVDVSAFKAGYLHLSYYVSSLAPFGNNFLLEITSAGTCDQEELHWEISLSSVQEGWNEVYLSVPDAGTSGKIDLSNVNYLRFYTTALNSGTTSFDVIIDDIYMTKSTNGAEVTDSSSSSGEDAAIVQDSYKETQAQNGVMIASCNTVNVFSQMKNLEVTTKSGQYVEGSGAMKITNGYSGSFMLKEPVDISKYMTQEGKLHVSVYVSDASLLTGTVNFYLSNVEDRDDAMMFWTINQVEFQSGWNEVELDFYASWMMRPINAEEVKYFNCNTTKPSGDLTLIIDNIYVSDN